MMYLACNCLEFTLLGGNMLLGYHWISPSIFLPIYIFLIYFIYFWLHWVFVAACALSLVVASGGYSSLWCAGFSLRWLLLLQSTGSRQVGFSSCGSRALERRLSSCGARAPRHVGSSRTRARTRVPCIARRILNHCTTREALFADIVNFSTLFLQKFCLHHTLPPLLLGLWQYDF